MRSALLLLPLASVLLLSGCETFTAGRSAEPAIDPDNARYANLASEVGSLRERLSQVELDLSQARQENATLRGELDNTRRGQPSAVTRAELDTALTQVRADAAQQRREIAEQVNRSIEDLARRTNQALDQMARQVNARASTVRPSGGTTTSAPPLPADTPGQVYTVQAGDTLSSIARKFGVPMADIQRANQLSTTTIRVGQNLFIPEKR